MPDHVHIVLEGRDDNANLRSLMHSWNTRTGFEWRRQTGSRLCKAGITTMCSASGITRLECAAMC